MTWNLKLITLFAWLILPPGCTYYQDMANQPRYDPFEASAQFGDGNSARPAVIGTVAWQSLPADPILATGKQTDGSYVAKAPLAAKPKVLRQGEIRFNANCAVCHGFTAKGDGPVSQRGFLPPPSLLDERIRNLPDGQIFEVMTNGFGVMPSYAPQVTPEQRWAIILYIRLLQGTLDRQE